MGSPASALLTDLYQLAMLQGYLEQGMEELAVFEFFVRRLPKERRFLVAAGLEQALEYLQGLRFSQRELDWIAACGRFKPGFVDRLATLRFTGDVHAMPEGTVFFADEPILRVAAPLPQAQLVESRLINLLHFQTLIASKAARCVLVAPHKLLVDFGMRRAHGAEAGLLAARAGYIAGLDGTATVLAAPRFDIPVFGTMAHSFIECHDDEVRAFEHFARAQPGNVVLLIDTYDTEAAARKVVELAPRLAHDGIAIRGVRIDSGDLTRHAREVRRILDEAGHPEITIFASGSLDEHALQAMVAAGAPVDGFGIGTLLDTSADRPYLDCAYKLVEYAARPRRKRSEGKATWPGRKQVYRVLGEAGRLDHDILTIEGDAQSGRTLLEPVMASGRRLAPPPDLERIRAYTRCELQRLPDSLRGLGPAPAAAHEVRVTEALRRLAAAVDAHTP
jgi:nicotinate phosphoribosyltransferase